MIVTAGNNKKIHAVKEKHDDHFVTACGLKTPRRPQTTQKRLDKCRRCF